MVKALIPLLSFAVAVAAVKPHTYPIGRRGGTESYTVHDKNCSELVIPAVNWNFPEVITLRDTVNFKPLFLGVTRIEYRWLNEGSGDGRIAIAGIGFYGGSPEIMSPKKYAFTPHVPSNLREITDSEWNSGVPLKDKGIDGGAHETPKQLDVISFGSRVFHSALPDARYAEASPDSKRVAITSYTKRGLIHPLSLFPDFESDLPVTGKADVELCDVAAGTCSVVVNMRFHRVEQPGIGDVRWMTNNVFVISPLPSRQALVVCEVGSAK